MSKAPRLGLLIPSSNTTLEHEFNIMRPKEVTVHVARMQLKRVTLSQLVYMRKEMEAAAARLVDANVSVIGFGCTSGSLFRGLGHNQETSARIEKTTGKPAVTTAGAVLDALQALDLFRISVATPYNEEINALEREFLAENGFIIPKMRGLGIEDNLKIGEQSTRVVYDLVKEVNTAWSDGIFVSCTNLKTIEVIGELEEELEKPVVSSNTATMWAMLRKIRYERPLKGWGQLLKML